MDLGAKPGCLEFLTRTGLDRTPIVALLMMMNLKLKEKVPRFDEVSTIQKSITGKLTTIIEAHYKHDLERLMERFQ